LKKIYTKLQSEKIILGRTRHERSVTYEGWNFNSGNYLFATDTK